MSEAAAASIIYEENRIKVLDALKDAGSIIWTSPIGRFRTGFLPFS
jgi:hypothetical protein